VSGSVLALNYFLPVWFCGRKSRGKIQFTSVSSFVWGFFYSKNAKSWVKNFPFCLPTRNGIAYPVSLESLRMFCIKNCSLEFKMAVRIISIQTENRFSTNRQSLIQKSGKFLLWQKGKTNEKNYIYKTEELCRL
jgi:hypothetical protein